MYIFQDHLQTNFEMFYFLGEGLCSSCTDLKVAGDAHSHISFTLFPLHLLYSHVFFTPFPLHLLCSYIPFSGTDTSYLVILKCFFSLLRFFKRICAVGQGYSGRCKQPKQYHLSSYLLSNPTLEYPVLGSMKNQNKISKAFAEYQSRSTQRTLALY